MKRALRTIVLPERVQASGTAAAVTLQEGTRQGVFQLRQQHFRIEILKPLLTTEELCQMTGFTARFALKHPGLATARRRLGHRTIRWDTVTVLRQLGIGNAAAADNPLHEAPMMDATASIVEFPGWDESVFRPAPAPSASDGTPMPSVTD